MAAQATQYDENGRPIPQPVANGTASPLQTASQIGSAYIANQLAGQAVAIGASEAVPIATAINGGGSLVAGGGGAATTPEMAALAAPEAAGTLLPAAGIAAGAYTGYQQAKGAESFLKGDKMSTPQKLALALPTFGASLIPFGHSKKYYEGKVRKKLLSALFNGKPETATIGGQIYNFSDDKDGTRDYKMAEGPALNAGVQYFKPLAMAMLKKNGQEINKKNVDDLTRILYNEVSADGKVTEQELRDKTLGFIQHEGFKPSDIQTVLDEGKQNQFLSEGEAQQFGATLNTLRPGGKPLTYDKAITPPTETTAPVPPVVQPSPTGPIATASQSPQAPPPGGITPFNQPKTPLTPVAQDPSRVFGMPLPAQPASLPSFFKGSNGLR